jgi:hypothetical protein
MTAKGKRQDEGDVQGCKANGGRYAVTTYLDESTFEMLKMASRQMGCSVSKALGLGVAEVYATTQAVIVEQIKTGRLSSKLYNAVVKRERARLSEARLDVSFWAVATENAGNWDILDDCWGEGGLNDSCEEEELNEDG